MVTVQLTSTPRQFVALPGRAARWTELAIAAEPVQQKLGKDFGISEALHNWLTKADTEDGVSPGVWDELRVARTGCICVDRGAFGPGRAFLRVRHLPRGRSFPHSRDRQLDTGRHVSLPR